MDKAVRLNANASLYNERPDLFMAAAIGISDVLKLQGHTPVLTTSGPETAEAISGFEARSYNPGRQQLDLRSHLELLAASTDLAGPKTDFLVTDWDMFAEGTWYVFGVTIYEWQLSVQSVARFVRHTSDVKLQGKLMTHIARHEYAHMAGMISPQDYSHPDRRSGLYAGHCANVCTLQQVMMVPETLSLASKLDGHELAGFCAGCVTSLRRKA
ncbi:MAG: hypothetical protein JWM81_249 [Candidatus Saccharibacteria bacterium]|nr:hypothetical protein [Candidatus Saccharibacteria bacterium]